MTRLIPAGAIAIALAAPALADETHLPTPVHDIIVTNYIPAIQVSVTNVSQSPWAEDRELRVTSADPQIAIDGQAWCEHALGTQAYAVRARAYLANAVLQSSEVFVLAASGASAPQNFSGTHALENFELQIDYDIPRSWDSGATLTFNPVRVVEERLESFVGNGAGTPADFLRTDDVFETSITLSVAGWCRWSEFEPNKEYGGLRKIEIPAHIFYRRDPDARDRVTAMDTPGAVAASEPSRARPQVSTRDGSARPPASDTRPARARPARARPE